MLDLQVPLLAAKALLLLLLFAFVYSVMRRGIGDLRQIPDDKPFQPGGGGAARNGKVSYKKNIVGASELMVEDSDILAPETRFRIKEETTSLGRSPDSDVVLGKDDFVSGRHAQLSRHGGLLYVEDLDSTNGTYVNGRKTVGATPLRAGDTVRVGSTTFRYME
ncbi:MAG: FHA domain-containing protein [Rubrobacteraceae bacterium]